MSNLGLALTDFKGKPYEVDTDGAYWTKPDTVPTEIASGVQPLMRYEGRVKAKRFRRTTKKTNKSAGEVA